MPERRVAVEFQAVGNHGYPYRAVCSGCGWRSMGYAADHAARSMADAHTTCCDSGLIRPEKLLTDGWAYGVAVCGFVVRAPAGPYMRGESTELQDALRAHDAAVHPAKYEQDRIHEAMSKD